MDTRVAPLAPPYDPEIGTILERMMGRSGLEPLRLFRIVAHNKGVLDKLRSTGSYFLNFGTLDPLEREIVIHRTCARAGAEYEWGIHVLIYGRPLGLTDEQIASTVHGDAGDGAWTERQGLLLRLADELYDTDTISETLWGALAQHWSTEQLVELVALAGQYRMVSYVVNAFGIPPEDDAERW